MNNQITKIFSPTTDQGGLDGRFEEDLRIIFQSFGADVYRGLDSFSQKTSELEKTHGGYAMELCEAFFKRIKYLDENERDGSNQYRWKSKMLEKGLREGLQEIGFKPSKVSKLIGASRFLSSLPDARTDKRRFQALPVSCLYECSRMSWEGINKVFKLAEFNNTEWLPTKAELEEIVESYPKYRFEKRGRAKGLKPSEDDATAVSEPVSLSKYDKARLFTKLAIELAPEAGWKDTEMIEILSPAKQDLMQLAHIATLPIPETITI